MNPAELTQLTHIALVLFTGISVVIALMATLGLLVRSRPLQLVGYTGAAFVLLAAAILWGPETSVPIGRTDRTLAVIMLLTGSFALLIPLSSLLSHRVMKRSMKKLGEQMKNDPTLDLQTASRASTLLNDLAKEKID